MPSAVLSGHDDWVKCLDFRVPVLDHHLLILASGSQDATIRLWNIEPFQKDVSTTHTGSKEDPSDELLDSFEASLGIPEADEGGRQISLKRHILTVKGAERSSINFCQL